MKKLIFILLMVAPIIIFGQAKLNLEAKFELQKIYKSMLSKNDAVIKELANSCRIETIDVNEKESVAIFTGKNEKVKFAVGMNFKDSLIFFEEEDITYGKFRFDTSYTDIPYVRISYRYYVNPKKEEIVKVVASIYFLDNKRFFPDFEKELELTKNGYERGRTALKVDWCIKRIEYILKIMHEKC